MVSISLHANIQLQNINWAGFLFKWLVRGDDLIQFLSTDNL